MARGAGELLVTSIDRDGVRGGYDLALTAAMAAAVLVAGILHDGVTTVPDLKQAMAAGIPTRRTW